MGGASRLHTYINDHAGVDGIKIFVQECETAYTLERAFECYERYKNGYDGAPLAILVGTSSGFDVAASEKLRADKVPLTTPGGGREDSADGTGLPLSIPAFVRLLDGSVDRGRLYRQAGRRL
jgi:branched-chain amino acid transport system substrate-binding protein